MISKSFTVFWYLQVQNQCHRNRGEDDFYFSPIVNFSILLCKKNKKIECCHFGLVNILLICIWFVK